MRDVSLDGRAGRAADAARPLGLRQDHDLAHDRGLRGAGRGHDLDRRPGRHARAAQPARHRLRVPELRAVPASSVFENVAYGLRVQRHDRSRDRARASARCWSWSASPATSASSRTSSRAASSSAWRWRAPSSSSPGCCCSTSRFATSTPSCGSRCASEIRALQKRLGITTVYVTHDQEEAMAISDRIAVMDKGAVVQEGTAEDLYYRPAQRIRRPLHRPRQPARGPRDVGAGRGGERRARSRSPPARRSARP